MATVTVDLQMTRGDTLKFDGTLTPGTGQSFTTPVQSLSLSAKRKYSDGTVVFEKTLLSTMVIVSQSSSSINYSGKIEPIDTSVLTAKDGKLLYDLQLVEADGTVSTPVGGELKILPDVTP